MTLQQLPKISIIVPNFNSGATIGRTLQSLVDQNYPSLEIFVFDALSSDNSVEIIKSYESKITWWVSEKDRGQSDAINKGFARCSGEIVNWLCADDLLEPGALDAVADAFSADPHLDVLAGAAIHQSTFPGGRTSESHPSLDSIRRFPLGNDIPQPACFYRRRLLKRNPPLDESLHYVMDFELWCYFVSCGAKWGITDRILARAMVDGKNKISVGAAKITAEMEIVYGRYVHNERIPLVVWYRRLGYPLDCWRRRHPGGAVSLLVKSMKFLMYLALAPFYGGLRRVRSVNWSAYT